MTSRFSPRLLRTLIPGLAIASHLLAGLAFAQAQPARESQHVETIPVAVDPGGDPNWAIPVDITPGAGQFTAGFGIDVSGSGGGLQTWHWQAPSATKLRLSKWRRGLYFEVDGKTLKFAWLPAGGLKDVVVEVATGSGTPPVIATKPVAKKWDAPSLSGSPLKRPFDRHIFVTALNWMNRYHYRTSAPLEYDMPIAPLDEGLDWDLSQMASNGVDVVALDNLATKRPDEVVAFYQMAGRWRDAIAGFTGGPIFFAPFWEYNSGHSLAGEFDGMPEAENYFCDISGGFLAWSGSTSSLFKIQDRSFQFVYDAMVLDKPDFWTAVAGQMKASGVCPVLSLGIGGIPMTAQGLFSGSDLAAYTDSLFESVFLFQLWTTKADRLPGLLVDYLSKRSPSCYVVGAGSPGYWSVRPQMQNYVDFRYTERLRETLQASTRAGVDGIHLTTWDDWEENTCFAPSFNNLNSRLEIVNAETAEWRHVPVAVPARMPRVIVSYKRTWRKGEPFGVEVLALPTSGFDSTVEAEIQVLDQNSNVVSDLATPSLDALKCGSFLCSTSTEKGAWRAVKGPSALALKVTIRCGGKKFQSVHLPQVAVLPDGFLDTDLLYYSVPLHHLAGPDKTVRLMVNGAAQRAAYSGIVGYGLDVKGADSDQVRFAMTRNGHPLRYMAPWGMSGAEASLGRAPDMTLSPRNVQAPLWDALPATMPYPQPKGAQNPYVGKSATSLCTNGMMHYDGLVGFRDGTYAYTNMVWCVPAVDYASISAMWVMDADENGRIYDMGPQQRNLQIAWDGEKLRSARSADGHPGISMSDLTGIPLPVNVMPAGPATVECLFSYSRTGRRMSLFSQVGSAQLSLSIESDGRLVLERSSPGNDRDKVVSEPLKAASLIAAAAVYTGSKILLYVNGSLVGETAVTGSRTNEGVLFGGSPSAPFSGQICKLAIFSGAVPEAVLMKDFQDGRL